MAATFNSSAVLGPNGHLYKESESKLAAQNNGLLALSVVFLFTSWVTTALRVYVRGFVIKAFGMDDIFAVLTLLVVAGYCLYGATMLSFKFALGFFFLKIFQTNAKYRITIWASVLIPTVFGVLNIIWTGLYPCQVSQFFFIGLATCESGLNTNSAWLAITAIWSALTAITDLLYGVLSVLAIRSLQMRWQAKVTAACLCALGSIGGIASCVRFVLLIVNDMPGISQLGASILAAQWSIIEPGIGITAAAMATLRPLVRKLNEGSSKPTGASTQGQGGTTKRDTARISKYNSKAANAGILVEVELNQFEGGSSEDLESQAHGKVSQSVDREAAAKPAQII
ncbi:hypothetical protein ANO11243_032750 [Dothideomycetidae sp. 11243]|nr:hypothetical protein ANO11243_032750 [fungal sp. No.11243]